MIKRIDFEGFSNCLRVSNGEVELIASADFGPRILFYGFAGGENILGLHREAKVETALGVWRPYGGHRLWLAPENMPNSYAPDDFPVENEFDEEKNSLRLIQSVEPVSKTQKEIVITLENSGTKATIEHRIINRGTSEIVLAPWALTIMRGGGEAIVPNEPFAPYGGDTLLPVRNLTLWSYTDFSDSRWTFDREFIRLRTDETKTEAQKIGVLNKQAWAAYQWENLLFVKRFRYLENAPYPDMNSNTELYTAGDFIEVETLAPLQTLHPGETATHVENWQLFKDTEIGAAVK